MFEEIRVCYTDPSRVVDQGEDDAKCDTLVNTDETIPGVFLERVAVAGGITGCEGDACNASGKVDVSFLSEETLVTIFGQDYSTAEISVWFSDAAMNGEGCCRYFYTDLFYLTEEELDLLSAGYLADGCCHGTRRGSTLGLVHAAPQNGLGD